MSDTDVQVPPIRTDLYDPNLTDQTAKEWYLYWKNSGDRINTLNRMVAQGNHGDRPDAGDAPDGAIYVEADRSVIYINEGGEWHYLAGTMWGTLNPDQRPAGLGVNDAGFEFRSIDSSDTYAPRTFVWSGTEWIETTLVLYGLHANRPVADEKTPPRTLYVETDRSGVIYQQQANAWHFLAGTMWGTLSPDQRPTDLGANDAGFTFRGTDIARSYVWSGTIWIETTPLIDPTTSKGDLITRTSTAVVRQPIGTDGQVLTADSTQADGMKWASPVTITTQAVVTGSRALAGIYQNTGTTPRYVAVGVVINAGANVAVQAYCDAGASPGTIVTASYAGGLSVATISPLFFIVLPGYFYKVVSSTGAGVSLNFWTEWQ